MKYKFNIKTENGREVFVVGMSTKPEDMFKAVAYGSAMCAESSGDITNLGTLVVYRHRTRPVTLAIHGNEEQNFISVYSIQRKLADAELDSIKSTMNIAETSVPSDVMKKFLDYDRILSGEVMK